MNMFKKMIILLLSLLICEGCYSYSIVTPENRGKISDSEIIYEVEMNNGNIIDFAQNNLNQAHIQDSVIIGKQNVGSTISVPIKDVKNFYIKQSDDTKTIFAAVLITGAVVGFLYVLFYPDFSNSNPVHLKF